MGKDNNCRATIAILKQCNGSCACLRWHRWLITSDGVYNSAVYFGEDVCVIYRSESLLCVQLDLLLHRFGVARIHFPPLLKKREQQDKIMQVIIFSFLYVCKETHRFMYHQVVYRLTLAEYHIAYKNISIRKEVIV